MRNEDRKKFKNEFIKRLIRFSITVLNYCKDIGNDKLMSVIANQLVRSSSSIGANVVEAQASSSKKDYIKYFQIALKSANETTYWLLVLKNSDSSKKDKANRLLLECKEISSIIATSLLTLKGKR
jgi:four helix bundle protein